MSNFVVDVEADGPCPGIYSMVSFGAVLVEDLSKTFYGECLPIGEKYNPESLEVCGISRERSLTFPNPCDTMIRFKGWIERVNNTYRPIFWSDNLAFDWQFINYYFHKYLGENPFGYSGRRISDYYCGMKRNLRAKWKHLRRTKHDHNPVNDAIGNAEAMRTIGIIYGKWFDEQNEQN